MDKAFFSIDTLASVVLVKKSGYWDIVTDIAYVTELGEVFTKFKTSKFITVVDMRGWICPEEVKNSEFKTKVVLDRRSQTGECWVIDEAKYSDHLLQFVKSPSLDFVRSDDRAAIYTWLERQPIGDYEIEAVKQWLGNVSDVDSVS